MRNGIFVPLLDEHREALIDLADREWRRPVDQAAKILIEGLQRERVLPERKTATDVESAMTRLAMNGARQLTLGALIRCLESFPLTFESQGAAHSKHVYFDFGRTYPKYLSSYRGSYDELAIEFASRGAERPTAEAFLKQLRNAVGTRYPGWKGGEYRMGVHTPLWVAQCGESGYTAVVGVRDVDYEIILDTAWCEF